MDLSVELRNRTASDPSAAYTEGSAEPFFRKRFPEIDKSITCAHVEKKGKHAISGKTL